ncbi:hypothetical protein CEXT_722411 [Caerostris extrusa]|uniref:Secreted protein n=1 Tax=Caerostris extrusa TaxID=172846 RepID=A0AAV4TJM0_CAEEX|nr:hypothetical protein CEXT_722411 [Caerostris extrusa]
MQKNVIYITLLALEGIFSLSSIPSFQQQNINNFFDRLWKRGSPDEGGNKTIPSIFGGERGFKRPLAPDCFFSRIAMTAINGTRDVACPTSPLVHFTLRLQSSLSHCHSYSL